MKINRLFHIAFGMASILAFSSCEKQPVACFSVNSTVIPIGHTVVFENCSENGDLYEWEFGDGRKVKEQWPSVMYSDAGNYLVKLKVTSLSGALSDSAYVEISVGDVYISEVRVTELSVVDNDSSGADLFFLWDNTYKQFYNDYDYKTDVILDVLPSDLPVGWDCTGQQLKIWSTGWRWNLAELDFTPADTAGVLFNIANPIVEFSNPLTLTQSGNTVEVYFEIRTD